MGELKMSTENEGETLPDLEEFVATGRTGRRNAMADLCNAAGLDPNSDAYKLAEKMAELATDTNATNPTKQNEAETSKNC